MKKVGLILYILTMLVASPVFALDFDAVDNSSSRKNYTSEPIQSIQTIQQIPAQTTPTTINQSPVQVEPTSVQSQTIIKEQVVVPEQPKQTQQYEKLPDVPKLPAKANSKTVAPINTMYTGKIIDENAIETCRDIKVEELVLDNRYKKEKVVNYVAPKQTTKTKTVSATNYRYRRIAKGSQFRVVNTTKISDYMIEGQKIVFKNTQEIRTPYVTVPKGAKFVGVVEDVHRPQMTCNGGLVDIRIRAVELNGKHHNVDASIIKLNTERIAFGNLKGDHTYWKTTCKKAKWGQTKFKQWSQTSAKLADKGPAIVVAPFPYIGGCVLAVSSTVTSPITALLGKGGSLTIPANTVFTIKLNEEAKIAY